MFMEGVIYSPRFKFKLLQTQELGSSDLADFHRVASDPKATQWTLRGTSNSIEQSQEFLTPFLSTSGAFTYMIHHRDPPATDDQNVQDKDERWSVIGQISLLPAEPVIPLPAIPKDLETGTETESNQQPIKVYTLGYRFLPEVWGQGYATEAVTTLISHHREKVVGEGRKDRIFFQAIVSADNPASQRVLQKSGVAQYGAKDWEEKVFLAGDWRGPITPMFGIYL